MALAGILQSLAQVQKLARYGDVDSQTLTASLTSIVETDPDKTEDIYQDKFALQVGYRLLLEQLGDGKRKDMEITRYLIGIMTLERKLMRSASSLGILSERINQVKRQLNHFDLNDEQVIANLASIYSDVISDLGPKIQIIGNPEYLQRTSVQQKIRSLLLAAMRSAVLWRQLGGKRRHLIFSRKAMIHTAQNSLSLSN